MKNVDCEALTKNYFYNKTMCVDKRPSTDLGQILVQYQVRKVFTYSFMSFQLLLQITRVTYVHVLNAFTLLAFSRVRISD
jgi:hypothetical protein